MALATSAWRESLARSWRSHSSNVLREAYAAGHEAGEQFEYRQGIGAQAQGEVEA